MYVYVPSCNDKGMKKNCMETLKVLFLLFKTKKDEIKSSKGSMLLNILYLLFEVLLPKKVFRCKFLITITSILIYVNKKKCYSNDLLIVKKKKKKHNF